MSTTVTARDPDSKIASELSKTEGELRRLRSHMAAVREAWPHVVEIKTALQSGDGFYAIQLFDELDHEKQRALWISTKSGGIWTTKERALIRDHWGK